ncbi:MAG: leucine-rich repeat domain-containing protein [Clostridia bacterium]|nr:leucine-rich repeat domain-containing protein [Clostridia bacterium]
MRKLIVIIMSCLISVSIFAASVFAESTDDGLYTYDIITDGDLTYIRISGYNGAFTGDITIPDEIDGHRVTYFGGGFSGAESEGSGNADLFTTHIGTLTLPKYLNNFRITKGMFAVERFAVPDDASDIAVDQTGALYSSDGTEFYIYPAYNQAKEYRIADTVNTVYEVCSYSRYLERIIIPGSVRSLPQTCFTFAQALKEIILEEGVETIEDNCTGDCPSLERIVLPSTLTTIGHNGLSGLRKVKEIVIPASVESIGYAGLSDNDIMERVVFMGLPENESSTPYYSILGANPMLTDLYFAGSEEEWNDSAFYGLVPDNVTIHFDADYVTQNDVMIDYSDGVLALKGGNVNGGNSNESLFPWDFYANDCVALSLDPDVNTVGANAFHDFTSLSEVVISGDGVTIEEDAFAGCENLSTIIVSGDVDIEDGALPADVTVYAPVDAAVTGTGFSVVRFDYDDNTITLKCNMDTDAYTFLDLISVLCERFGETDTVRVSSLRLDDARIYYYDEDGNKTSLDNDALTDGSITVGITGADEDRSIPFNELCSGIADGSISSFFFTVATENGNESADTPVEIKEDDGGIGGFIRRALKAIVTLLNRLFNLLKKLR